MNDQPSFLNETDAPLASAPTPDPSKKKKRRTFLWLGVVFLMLVVVGGTAVYYYYQRNSEQIAYQVLENNENVADYEDFLARFPDSSHAQEVRRRLDTLKTMYAEWQRLATSSFVQDFVRFKNTYPQSLLVKQCDLKIDSLDWLDALKENTADAIADYLRKHPDGRYLSEAQVAQANIENTQVSEVELRIIDENLNGFFEAFGNNDEAGLLTFITPVMKQFLSKNNATKVDVADLVNSTYNEHILQCRFALNDDYVCQKQIDDQGAATYTVRFSVDQHITRDNPGKTFGSYTVVAELNAQYKIQSLVMNEVSRKMSNETTPAP